MGPTTWHLLAAPFAAGLVLAALAGPARADSRVTVDPDRVLSAWEGFGCSLVWWANQFGARDDLADTLFTTRTVELATDSGTYRLPGLGFKIVRTARPGLAPVAPTTKWLEEYHQRMSPMWSGEETMAHGLKHIREPVQAALDRARKDD